MSGLRSELEARFEFVRELGRGSFGSVHEARDRETGESYALKLLNEDADLDRAEREIEASLLLAHPRVIRCHEGKRRGDEAYLLLEMATGSLDEQIRDTERLAENWKLLRQAADGVAAIHNLGLVHRDLKPDNILLGPRGAKVSDLGLAKGGDLVTLTKTGVMVGTPGYMSPEQVAGKKLTPASDLFSLAVMFYEAVEGRLPWPSTDPIAMVLLIAQGEIQDFSRGFEVLPESQLRLLQAALDPDPEKRPANVARWSEELGAYVAPTEEERVGSSRRTVRLSESLPGVRAADLRGAPEAEQGKKGGLPTWFLVAGGLAMASLGFLSGGPFAPRQVDPREAWPEPLVEALGKSFPEDVLRELEGMPEATTRDPARWGEVLRGSPAVQRYAAWLEGGGRPGGLPLDLVDDLRRCDRHFLERGLPPPFRLSLEVHAREKPWELSARQRRLALRQLPEGSVPEKVEGWLATALERFEAASSAERKRRDLAAEYVGGHEVPGIPAGLPAPSGGGGMFGGLTGEDGVDAWLREGWSRPEGRRALDGWLREDRRGLAAALYAVRRALAEPGAEADRIEGLVGGELERVHILWYGAESSVEDTGLTPYLDFLRLEGTLPVRVAAAGESGAPEDRLREKGLQLLRAVPRGAGGEARWLRVFATLLERSAGAPDRLLELHREAGGRLHTLSRSARFPWVLRLAEALVGLPGEAALPPEEYRTLRDDISLMRRLEPYHGTVDMDAVLDALDRFSGEPGEPTDTESTSPR